MTSFLLMAREGTIKGSDLKTGKNDVIAPWTGSYVIRPLAMDFDINTKRIYWTGPFNTKNKEVWPKQPQYGIMAAKTDHSELSVIVDTG